MPQGVGHLDIGENIGAAQVFNPMPAIQQYGQMLQQRKDKHDAEVKQLGDELAKGYDPNGLRNDADKTKYIGRYNDIKEAAIAAENEKDQTKKALGLAQVRQQLTDLASFADASKKRGLKEVQLIHDRMLHPYMYDDASFDKIKNSLSLAVDDPNNWKSEAEFERGVDPNKMEAEYQKVNSELLKSHPATYGPETIKDGQNVFGRKTATGTSYRVIPYKDVLEMHLHGTTADLDYQKYLKDRYPKITDQDQQVQLAKRVAQDVADHGQQNGLYDKPKVKEYEEPAPDKFYAHRDYEVTHPILGAGNGLTPIQTHYIQPMIQQGLPALQKFADLANQASQGNFRPGEKVVPDVVNGYDVFHVPDQVKIDPEIVASNKAAESYYNKHTHKSDQILGMFGGKPIPWVKSDDYKNNYVDPYKVVKQGGDVTLNPQDQTDYAAKVAELSTRLKVPVDAINKMAGAKSGKGEIPKTNVAKPAQQPPKQYTVTGKYKGTYNSQQIHEKAVKFGYTDQEYVDWLNSQK